MDDYFEEINDDAFLNIDLDALVGASKLHENENTKNGNDSSKIDENIVSAKAIVIKQDECVDTLLLSHKSLLIFLAKSLSECKVNSKCSTTN